MEVGRGLGRCIIGAAAIGSAVVGCASQKPVEDLSQKGDARPVEPEPEPTVEPEPAPPIVQSEPTATSPPAPSAEEVVTAVCEETCKKTEVACDERAASFCRASCRDYEMATQKCPVEVHDALSCQGKADSFLLCSNVAAEACGPLFLAMQNCRSGKVEPKPWGALLAQTEAGQMPAGWQRLSAQKAGFSVLVPASVKPLESAALFQAKGQGEAGVEFIVEIIEEDNPRKPTDSSILRLATKYLGADCQSKLRLHGRYDKADVIHVRLDTMCADNTRYQGMLHLWSGRAVITTTRYAADALPSGQNPAYLEDFIFSFQKEAAASTP